MNYPEFAARFYDVIYSRIRTSVDHTYYFQKMTCAKGPVLEVGVETGRLFFDALKNGTDVYGVDISRTMVKRLKRKLTPSEMKRISVQDDRKLSLKKRFRLIVAPFRVLSHLISAQDQLRALHKIHAHLDRNGIFIFDLFVPHLKMCAEGMPPTVDFDGTWETGKKLKRVSAVTPDPIRQINHVTMQYVWEEGGKMRDKNWEFPMRYFYRYEVQHLVSRAGFKRVQIFGDFKEKAPANDSKEFVVVCAK